VYYLENEQETVRTIKLHFFDQRQPPQKLQNRHLA